MIINREDVQKFYTRCYRLGLKYEIRGICYGAYIDSNKDTVLVAHFANDRVTLELHDTKLFHWKDNQYLIKGAKKNENL